ncbi:MAG: hypothetical protein AAF358_00815 [Pseudomonadota bacterium]
MIDIRAKRPCFRLVPGIVLAMIAVVLTNAATAQSTIHDVSAASGISVAAPVAFAGLSAATTLAAATHITVKSIEVSAVGTAVVAEALVDGAVTAVSFTIDGAAGFAAGAGTVLEAASVAGGVLLYDGSQAIALLADEEGQKLLFHERLTP